MNSVKSFNLKFFEDFFYTVDLFLGIHPANPVKMVNFNETSDIDGIDPFSTSLVNRFKEK